MRTSRRLLHFKRKRCSILNKGPERSGKLDLWMQQLSEEGNTSGGVNTFLAANTVMQYFRLVLQELVPGHGILFYFM
jgi:hypothetical protein